MRVMVIGAGVAGLVAAAELAARNDVTLCEREKSLRTEGYMIDFFGPGLDVADRLGILPQLEAIHYPVERLLFIDGRSRPRGAIDYGRARRVAFHDRHYNFMRGDLERVLFERLPAAVRVRFGMSVRQLDQRPEGVAVEFEDGTYDWYDVVLGCDGVHSRTRALALAPNAIELVRLGCRTAAYVFEGRLDSVDGRSFVSLTEAGITAACYPIHRDRTATFFLYRAQGTLDSRSPASCAAELEAAFRGKGELPDGLLDRFPERGAVYFDDVLQVVVDRWWRGRIALVGDASGAVSLLAGQGASMAVAGAYVLAQELDRDDDYAAAFTRYEARVRPAVEARQKSGRRNARWFLPRSHLGAVLRDRVSDLVMRTALAPLVAGRIGASGIPLDVAADASA